MEQHQPCTLDLTHLQGQHLLECLEDLLERLPCDPQRLEWLEDLIERVGCANAVALWLREYVHVDLGGEEAEELLGLLPEHLDAEEQHAAVCLCDLAEIRQQLRQATRHLAGAAVHA